MLSGSRQPSYVIRVGRKIFRFKELDRANGITTESFVVSADFVEHPR